MPDIAQRIQNDFKYHQATTSTGPVHQHIREECQKLAEEFLRIIPDGRELSLALTKLEEAMLWANAGIARNS